MKKGFFALAIVAVVALLLGDTWEATMQDTSIIDPRLSLMIPAFKTGADNSKKN